MLISFEKPPMWDKVQEMFDIGGGTLFSYGDVVYNPGKVYIPEDLIVHEQTHLEQQELNRESAKVWWERYLSDAEFRVQQEVEAYGEQFKFLCRTMKHGKDRNQQARWLNILAAQLAGPLYGKMISRQDALRRIRDYANGKSIKNIEDEIGE